MAAISGVIEFWASSGAPSAARQLANLLPMSGQDYNRVGFFGTGGPGNFIRINEYQDTTYIVNEDGNPSGAFTASGKLSNVKYVTSTTLNPNSSGVIAVSGLTMPDATVRIRFTEPSGTAVQTQNGKFRAINLNASSGTDDCTINVSGVNIYAFEVPQATSWTLISQAGAVNYISLTSRTSAKIWHDFHIALSASPLAVGIKNNFAFEVYLEFL